MKDTLRIAMVLVIMAIPIFITLNSENDKNKALAVSLSDYSEAAQKLIKDYELHLENYDGYKLNESLLLTKGIVVYGKPSDVPGNDYKGEIPRYSGYDLYGNKYTTWGFPVDQDAQPHVGKNWIKNPWDSPTGLDKGIVTPEYLEDPEARQAVIEMLETMLDSYDQDNQKVPPTGRTWLEAYNEITGKNWTGETLLDYVVINNFNSDFGQGSVTIWNIGLDGNWWYQTFNIPPKKGFIPVETPDLPPDYSCTNNCSSSKTSGITYTNPYHKWICTDYDEEVSGCIDGYWEPKDYYEYLSTSISMDSSSTVKAGYGFSFKVNTSYNNEWYGPDEVSGPTSMTAYFESADSFLPTSVSLIPLNGSGAWENTWVLPEVYVEKFSGNLFYNTFDPNRDYSDELISGGQKWYIPFKQKDGSFSFRVEVSGAGTTGLHDCQSQCVIVKGSPFDDHVIRLVSPNNPFPAGVGDNWQGYESIITNLNDWYYEKHIRGEMPQQTNEWVN